MNQTPWKPMVLLMFCAFLTGPAGCRSHAPQKKQDQFFTSGSREADQRASQQMAKQQQLAGTNDNKSKKPESGSNEKSKKADNDNKDQSTAATVPQKLTLYERLGQEQGLTSIMDDFVTRVLQDPRVNWGRKGTRKRSWFSWGRKENIPVEWSGSAEQVTALKRHMVQFLSLATGGPPKYEGKEIRAVHGGMQITNPEFDAAMGDLKASLDRMQIADREQKELLAIVESTRPEIVTQR